MQTQETLKTILTHGAGLSIDARTIGITPLIEIVSVARIHDALLTVTHADSLVKDSIEQLSELGGTTIRFEF